MGQRPATEMENSRNIYTAAPEVGGGGPPRANHKSGIRAVLLGSAVGPATPKRPVAVAKSVTALGPQIHRGRGGGGTGTSPGTPGGGARRPAWSAQAQGRETGHSISTPQKAFTDQGRDRQGGFDLPLYNQKKAGAKGGPQGT